MIMDFSYLAQSRYSVRSFTDRKVEREKLDIILNAAKVAPDSKPAAGHGAFRPFEETVKFL